MRVRVIALEGEILVFEIKDILHIRVEDHAGQRAGLTGELKVDLLHVVIINVSIADGMDEIAGLQAGDLRHHQEQKGVGGDVEGDAKERVAAALIELEAELAVGHVKLEEGVAGGEVHVVEVGHVPGADDDSARVGVVLDVMDGLGYLVDVAAAIVGP